MGKNIIFKFVFVNISSQFPDWDGNVFYRNTYVGYELEAHRFRHKLARLENDMAGSKPSLRQWLGSMEPWQWAQCFDEGYRYGHMMTNLVETVDNFNAKNGVETSKIVRGGTHTRRRYQGCLERECSKGPVDDTELYSQNLKTFRVIEYIDRQSGIPPRSYGVDLKNKRCECGYSKHYVTRRVPRIKGYIDMRNATACVRDVAMLGAEYDIHKNCTI
ncbi:hypothetical protein GOBAR_DD02806 [Gossypium barbadense]|nr:hypothetical protein GOBAR_DD02806 [Gossypium barbadense]